MEDVLDVYCRPYDERFPVVCLDETSKQLVGELRSPLPMERGKPERFDSHYRRQGVCNLFLCCEPLRGGRHVKVTARRTKIDFAQLIRELVDQHYPEADKIVLVMDNLNTHTPAALYDAFEPTEAKRLCDRIEIHYTPKHGSWLNMAECELSVLSRQCTNRRIPDQATLRREVEAWQRERNAKQVTVDWQFTTQDARIKLKHLYPCIHE
jgi:transposase